MKQITYLHKRVTKQNVRGGATVSIIPTSERGLYKVGFAICGTKDQFCKRIGREIAEGRVVKHPVKVYIDDCEFSNKDDLVVKLLQVACPLKISKRLMKKIAGNTEKNSA